MIEIIAGTYEEFLLGYNFTKKKTLEQSFAAHDHTASIRTVALGGQYLATGGADDRIFIYDLKTRKEISCQNHHNATITALAFTPNHTHLMSASSDGVLAIVRLGNWQLEKLWAKPHKGAAILDIAVHSSETLALTLGADGTLSTWNLVKGRQAYVINLNTKSKEAKSLEKILWASDGVRFLLYGGRFVEIWSIENGGMLDFIENSEKVTCCLWFTSSSILIGHENGTITLIDIDDKSKRTIQAHDCRVKAMKMREELIVTISSRGEIKVWSEDIQQISSVDTGCRLTCLELLTAVAIKEDKEEQPAAEIEEIRSETTFKPYVVVETEEDTDIGPKRKVKGLSKNKKKRKTLK